MVGGDGGGGLDGILIGGGGFRWSEFWGWGGVSSGFWVGMGC